MSGFDLLFSYETCRNCGNLDIGKIWRESYARRKAGEDLDMGAFMDSKGLTRTCCRMHILSPIHLPPGLAALSSEERKKVWAKNPYDLNDPFYQPTTMITVEPMKYEDMVPDMPETDEEIIADVRRQQAKELEVPAPEVPIPAPEVPEPKTKGKGKGIKLELPPPPKKAGKKK